MTCSAAADAGQVKAQVAICPRPHGLKRMVRINRVSDIRPTSQTQPPTIGMWVASIPDHLDALGRLAGFWGGGVLRRYVCHAGTGAS